MWALVLSFALLLTLLPTHEGFVRWLNPSFSAVLTVPLQGNLQDGLKRRAVATARTYANANAADIATQQTTDSVAGQLHYLHKAGDVNGVLTTFQAALRGEHGEGVRPLQSYELSRASYNIGFQAMLRRNQRNEVRDVLNSIIGSGQKLQADTLHILLTDSFRRRDINEAEGLFSRHFAGNGFDTSTAATPHLLSPTIRTFNIMIEGHRALGNSKRARTFLDLMTRQGIVPDSYTFSSVIRMSDSGNEIVDLLAQIKAAGLKFSAPLIRTAVETLGQLGRPAEAFSTAITCLTVKNSLEFSSRSGDSLIAALLDEANRKACLPFTDGVDDLGVGGLSVDKAAFALAGVTDRSKASRLRCGSRGFFLLFSRLHCLSEEEISLDDGTKVKRGFDAELSEMRELLWQKLRAALLEGAETIQMRKQQVSSGVDLPDDETLVLNGRLSFSVLRCFTDDIVGAKRFWRDELMPFVKSGDPSATQEIYEMSLEALMYSCGLCGRPDIGLEIAVTVRKRSWPRERMEILSRLYFKGREAYRKVSPTKSLFYDNILNRGLEKSLCSELGAFDESQLQSAGASLAVKKIRIQF